MNSLRISLSWCTNATGEIVNHSYFFVDVYNITLTVTDNKIATGTITKQIIVSFGFNITWINSGYPYNPDKTKIIIYHNASNGIDYFDKPDPGIPSNVYFNVWLDAGLESPYDKLLCDARPPSDIIVWNVTIQSLENNSADVTVFWDTNISNQLSNIGILLLIDNMTKIDMMKNNNYSFALLGFENRQLQILIGKAFFTNILSKWNLVSIPYNQSVSEDNIIISYNGSDYSWDDAVSNSVILDLIYKWALCTIFRGKKLYIIKALSIIHVQDRKLSGMREK